MGGTVVLEFSRCTFGPENMGGNNMREDVDMRGKMLTSEGRWEHAREDVDMRGKMGT